MTQNQKKWGSIFLSILFVIWFIANSLPHDQTTPPMQKDNNAQEQEIQKAQDAPPLTLKELSYRLPLPPREPALNEEPSSSKKDAETQLPETEKPLAPSSSFERAEVKSDLEPTLAPQNVESKPELEPQSQFEPTVVTTKDDLVTKPAESITLEPITEKPVLAQQVTKGNQAVVSDVVKPIVASVATSKGRALLHVLEVGKGPSIEIAWSKDATIRARLYDRFVVCYGMEDAILSETGDLYRRADQIGQRWEINLDKYSGFLRSVFGEIPAKERQAYQEITKHHRLRGANQYVRIFPRSVDGALLGALHELIGEKYQKTTRITARYVISNKQIIVDGIFADEEQIIGQILLPSYQRCSV